MDISKIKQRLDSRNSNENLIPKRNVSQLYQLLKPNLVSMSLDEFTNLLGSSKCLEKSFFKPKPLTKTETKIPKRCLVIDTDDEETPDYPNFLEYNTEKGVWTDKLTGICYKENSYSSSVVKI